jgi:hypothetical protein
LVEFSLVFVLLLMLALGTFEYGMVFRDWLSVTIAAREGGRTAASAANFGEADCVILEASAGALQSLTSGRVTHVHIYKTDSGGAFAIGGMVNQYRPMLEGEELNPSLVACATTKWIAENGLPWDPDDRVNEEGGADWIGVRVDFEHSWMTNFLWWSGTMDGSDDAIFRLEPPQPD